MPLFRTHAQSQSLLRIIALAIEGRLPLAPLLRAFAEDQSQGQRRRVHRVAGLLEGGSSLPAALEQVAGVLPKRDVLAIRFGTQSGTLSITLRHLFEESGSLRSVRPSHGLRETLPYATVVLLVIVLIGAFLLVKIVPAHLQVMEDYGVESSLLQWEAHLGTLIMDYWWLAAAGLLLAWLLWTQRPGRSLRRRFVPRWCDMGTADVLQNLSVVSEAGRPIPGAISTLARYHHDPALRQKLLFVRNEVEQGASLWGTLQRTKLLAPTEVALLEASEKVGNRPWAMAQLVMCKRRRMQRRLELAGQVVEPVAVLLLGGVVLALFLGILSPVVNIMWHLTEWVWFP
jgi:type II secretory pathway component PulF